MNDEDRYRTLTRDWYQSENVAKHYHSSVVTGPLTLKTISHRIIAHREIKLIYHILAGLNPVPKNILDIPCGTGKLAEVFRSLGIPVVGADISQEMLKLLRDSNPVQKSYTALFRADATRLPYKDSAFDCIVCLRLLHRVPDTVRQNMIRELARVARHHLILSAGVNDGIQAARLWLRNTFSKFPPVPFPITRASFRQQSNTAGLSIVRSWDVLPILSSEVLFLLKKDETK